MEDERAAGPTEQVSRDELLSVRKNRTIIFKWRERGEIEASPLIQL